jgi:hypothetical protein
MMEFIMGFFVLYFATLLCLFGFYPDMVRSYVKNLLNFFF